MDIVYLKHLRTEAIIGIYEWEQRVRQTVIIDLDMATDNRKAAENDQIEDALNYKAVSKFILKFIHESRFRLVETLAERLAEALMREFRIPWLRLSVNKQGALRHTRDVGVLIERGTRT